MQGKNDNAMKGKAMKTLVRILSLAISVLSLTPAALADQFKLTEGTEVRLKVLDRLSSKLNHNGDEVRFEVIENVLAPDGKTILIKQGTAARGTVIQAHEKGMMGQKGELSITTHSTKDVNGNSIRIRGTFQQDGHGRLGPVVALSLIVTPLFLLMHGKDADISSGAVISAFTDEDKLVDVNTATVQAIVLPPTAITISPGSEKTLSAPAIQP